VYKQMKERSIQMYKAVVKDQKGKKGKKKGKVWRRRDEEEGVRKKKSSSPQRSLESALASKTGFVEPVMKGGKKAHVDDKHREFGPPKCKER